MIYTLICQICVLLNMNTTSGELRHVGFFLIGHFQIKLEVIRTQIKLLGTRFSERLIIQLLSDISINFFHTNLLIKFDNFQRLNLQIIVT